MNKNYKNLLGTSILALSAAMIFAGSANAGAFYLQEQSVKANGRAWSGETAERGVQQMWWNPASIGGIETKEAYFGATGILPKAKAANVGTRVVRPNLRVGTTIIPSTNLPVGGEQVQEDPVESGVLPTGGIAIPLNDKITIGVVATSPYSFTTDYDDNSWARYNADRTYLRTYDVQPTVAYQVTPELSLGLGLNIEYMEALLSNFIPSPLSASYPDGHQKLEGDGWDFGYSIGAQYHADKTEIGISYKSAIEHNLKGDLTISGLTDPVSVAAGVNTKVTGANASFSTPWQAQFGIRYHFTPKLTVQGQIVRFGWSEFDDLELTKLGHLSDTAMPFEYKDTTAISIGADYAFNDKLVLRGGVQTDSSPVKDGHRDPRVPDSDRVTFALGGSYKYNDLMTIDTAIGYTTFDEAQIDKNTASFAGTPLQTAIITNGRNYDSSAINIGIGASFKF